MLYPAEGQFLTVEGKQVHVVIKGKSGPPVVLIHGLSGNTRDFTYGLAERLALRYRVYAFDRPGLGYSDDLGVGSDTLVDQARIIKRAMAQMGVEKPLVVGQSYGGAVAMAWAVRFPGRIAGIVLVSAPTQVWDSGLPLMYWINSNPLLSKISTTLISAFTPESSVERALEDIFYPQEVPIGYDGHIGAGLTLRRETQYVNARHRANLKMELAALVPLYPSLALPVELVHGDADQTVDHEQHSFMTSLQINKAHLKVLPRIGHMPHHVAKEEVVAAVNRAATRAGLR